MNPAPITEVSVFSVMCDWWVLGAMMVILIAMLVLSGCFTLLWMFRKGAKRGQGEED